MSQKLQTLHKELVQVAGEYVARETKLLTLLQEFDKTRGYFHFGCTSLYRYCVEVLKLSDATAFNLTSVARKAVQVPALKSAIEAGELTLSKARKIVPVINKENQDQWLSLAKASTSRDIEKAVAKAQPQLAVEESVKYVAEDRISLTVGLSEQTIEKLKRVMDLESQCSKTAASREDALVAALDAYLEKHDPVKKAERAVVRAEKSVLRESKIDGFSIQVRNETVPGQERLRHKLGDDKSRSRTGDKRRTALPSALAHAVHMRDQRKCTFKSKNSVRCGATRWLDIHHIIPRSLGGADTIENLTTVCSAHHRLIHSR